MKFDILIFAILCLWIKCAMGAETLIFDASPTPQVGYVLRWGTSPINIIGSEALDTNRVAVLTNGPWGAFYFKVFSVATNNVESFPSNVLLATNLPAAPLQLRIGPPGTNAVFVEGSYDMQNWQRLAGPIFVASQSRQSFRSFTTNRPPPLP